ncbi:hypothetical protein F4820DRAFT_416228 [Hypoxylon rubiginosum]|uniref:Uncharacterized protein n=1 Tax=Hypoxylon rubiginosum TaxID=110542 RepID=A0ACB9Z585_9PEZI|nr:hypothetical protein F4820DRAFT_416228 [Hypoxylon rubiginosum]
MLTSSSISVRSAVLRQAGPPRFHETCISLKANLTQESETPESCEWFTNDGHNPGAVCSAGTFEKPTSFLIRGDFCAVYSDDGSTRDSNGITSTKFDFLNIWRFMQCFAIGA